MFLLIGVGERAGSGIPKILKGWTEQHWRSPIFSERLEPSEQTSLELHMEDLLPGESVDDLRDRFGGEFEDMSSDQRIVLCTAAVETTVSHGRAMTLCDMHPVDMTTLLRGLVQRGFLVRVGQGRGSRYRLPDVVPSSLFDAAGDEPSRRGLSQPSELSGQPSELPGRRPNASPDSLPGLLLRDLRLSIVDDLRTLNPELRAQLMEISRRASGGRVSRDVMAGVIATLCRGRYVTTRVLAELLDRSEVYLRQGHINPLVRSGDLVLAFPQAPNDPRQAYTAFEASRAG